MGSRLSNNRGLMTVVGAVPRPSLYELEVERPLAVVMVARVIAGSTEASAICEALAKLSDGMDNWARILAAILKSDASRVEWLLNLEKRGVRPRREVLEEAMMLLGVDPNNGDATR